MANKLFTDLTTAQQVTGFDILRRMRPLRDAQGNTVVETDVQIRNRVGLELLYEFVKARYLIEKSVADVITRTNEF